MVRASTRQAAPSIDEAIGGVSRLWASVEFALTVILSELMEVKSETALVVSAALDYRHRRDLINSLSALKLKGHPLADKLAAFMGNVSGMNTERNNVIHALWIFDTEKNRTVRLTMRNRGAYE